MTRDLQGKKKYTDQSIHNLSDHLSTEVLLHYQTQETSLIESNLFHTKLARKKIMLAKNLFKVTQNELSKEEQIIITDKLQHEVLQLFTSSQ
jgi:S-adenosylmethionine decarboxylase